MVRISPVNGWPALLIGRTLVVSDVHIGIEKELWSKGVRATDLSTRTMDYMESLLSEVRPKRIVINGDLRHNIPLFTKRERDDVLKFLELCETFGETLVVKGNHDGGIEEFAGRYVVGIRYEEKGITITHGHAAVEGERFVVGHVHPAFRITHGFASELVKVWMVNDRVTVLPVFSPFLVGQDVKDPSNWKGPIVRREPYFHIVTLEGVHLADVTR